MLIFPFDLRRKYAELAKNHAFDAHFCLKLKNIVYEIKNGFLHWNPH